MKTLIIYMITFKFSIVLLLFSITNGISAQTADFSASKTQVCRNEPIVFTASTPEAGSYEWLFGEGAMPSAASGEGPHSVYYSTPGLKTVSLIVNDTLENIVTDYLQVFSEPTAISDVKTSVCSGDIFEFNPQENITNGITSVFSWTVSTPGGLIVEPASGTGIITGSITNLVSQVLSATYTITPVSDFGCIGSPFTIELPVNPVPVMFAIPSSQKVCSGVPIRDIEMINANGISDVSYNWERDKVDIIEGIPVSGTGNISGILQNFSGIPEVVTFTITPRGPSGCAGSEVITRITVNPVPTLSFSIRSTFNITEGPYNLIGSPSGGVFSGPGVVAHENKFYPSLAGLGNKNITYTYEDQEGCYSSLSKPVNVVSAQAFIEGLPETGTICYSNSDIMLKGGSLNGLPGGYFSGKGITNLKPDSAVFNPVLAGAGTHTVSYFYFDFAQTLFEYIREVFVDSIGTVEFVNLPEEAELCQNNPPLELIATPFGGVFTASSGLTGNIFTPSSANTGLNEIRYTYTSETGCSKNALKTILVHEVPSVEFEASNTCISLSNPDSVIFINHTNTNTDPVTTWQWNFGDNLATERENSSGLFSPGHLYRTPGLRNVSLTATTDKSCSNSIIKQIEIGDKPRVNFTWDSECFSEGKMVNFTDESESNTPIEAYKWTFYDKAGQGVLYNTEEINARFVFPELAYYNVKLELRTQLNCTDSIQKAIHLRPSFKITGDDFAEDFSDGTYGWVPETAEGVNTNSWVFGPTKGSGFGKPDETGNAWFTRIAKLNATEQSWVTSPCFDFSEASRPVIKLDLWRHFERNRDGVSIQYSTDNGLSWNNIGSLGEGINWYNSFQIAGNPGGQQIGWTAPSNGLPDSGWVQAVHDLDFLAGEPDVRLRLAYGSNGTGLNNKGVAFNNLNIRERTRTVLLENFTNTSVSGSASANNIIGNVVQSKPNDISVINYHTGFQGVDPLNQHNKADPSARALFYGISGAPYAIMDGGLSGKGRYDFMLEEFNVTDLNLRSFIAPAFNIKISQQSVDGIINIKLDLKALKNFSENELTLHVAVIESEIAAALVGLGGDVIFRNVVKKLLPDASGSRLPLIWSKDDSATYNFFWNIANVFDIEKIGVVAFIQDEKSKEIHQSASNLKYIAPIGIEPGLQTSIPGKVSVFPNPVRDHLFISFEHELTIGAKLEIFSITGKLFISEILPAGNSLHYLDTGILEKGVYVYRISRGSNMQESGRIVVLE